MLGCGRVGLWINRAMGGKLWFLGDCCGLDCKRMSGRVGAGFVSEIRSTPWGARLCSGPLGSWSAWDGTLLCEGVVTREPCLLLERLGAPEAG
jgi:hypothetical protein